MGMNLTTLLQQRLQRARDSRESHVESSRSSSVWRTLANYCCAHANGATRLGDRFGKARALGAHCNPVLHSAVSCDGLMT